MRNAGSFEADRIVGILVMVLSALACVGGVAILGLLSAFVFAGPIASQHHMGVPAAISGVALIFIVGATILQFASGYGIYTGQRWGLIMGLVLNAVTLLGGNMHSFIAIGVLIYCICRLSGSIGPRP